MDETNKPSISPLDSSPLVSKETAIISSVKTPSIVPLEIPQRDDRILPRNILPGSIQGVQVFSWGGPTGVSIAGDKGLYAGALTFALAPFSVDLLGNVVASSLTVSGGTITGSTITGSTITGSLIIGGIIETATTGQRIVLNGPNNSIDIYDAAALVGQILGLAGVIYVSPVTSTFFDKDVGINNVLIVGQNSTFINDLLVGNDLDVLGDLNVSGAKSFDIEHPTDNTKRLRYVAVEAPEVLVTCRGTAESEDDIEYPQHFIDVTEDGSIQCLVGKLKGSTDIAWVATGVRKGYADFEPEYLKEGSRTHENTQKIVDAKEKISAIKEEHDSIDHENE